MRYDRSVSCDLLACCERNASSLRVLFFSPLLSSAKASFCHNLRLEPLCDGDVARFAAEQRDLRVSENCAIDRDCDQQPVNVRIATDANLKCTLTLPL